VIKTLTTVVIDYTTKSCKAGRVRVHPEWLAQQDPLNPVGFQTDTSRL